MLPTDIAARPWRAQYAEIEAAVTAYLAALPSGSVLTTRELAKALGAVPANEQLVSSRLLKLAPWKPALATHDGEEFESFGRKNRRWRWHGQKSLSVNVQAPAPD